MNNHRDDNIRPNNNSNSFSSKDRGIFVLTVLCFLLAILMAIINVNTQFQKVGFSAFLSIGVTLVLYHFLKDTIHFENPRYTEIVEGVVGVGCVAAFTSLTYNYALPNLDDPNIFPKEGWFAVEEASLAPLDLKLNGEIFISKPNTQVLRDKKWKIIEEANELLIIPDNDEVEKSHVYGHIPKNELELNSYHHKNDYLNSLKNDLTIIEVRYEFNKESYVGLNKVIDNDLYDWAEFEKLPFDIEIEIPDRTWFQISIISEQDTIKNGVTNKWSETLLIDDIFYLVKLRSRDADNSEKGLEGSIIGHFHFLVQKMEI